ncbi:hypothetical protein NC652_041473 [Populus alba x Populus x berolinensis]|nr:hypothetical protein NC652_041473 [Populus alba x Populus x berolinensis]
MEKVEKAPNDPESEETEAIELILYQVSECYVYLIPPRKSAASYSVAQILLIMENYGNRVHQSNKDVEAQRAFVIGIVDKRFFPSFANQEIDRRTTRHLKIPEVIFQAYNAIEYLNLWTILLLKRVFTYWIWIFISLEGYFRADEWDVNKWAWEGTLKVISKGEECIIRLEDKTTGELYARAFLRKGEQHPVEPVIDSSRYFVLRIEENIGELPRYLDKKKTAEDMEQHFQETSSVDYSLKEGETLVLQMKNKPRGSVKSNGLDRRFSTRPNWIQSTNQLLSCRTKLHVAGIITGPTKPRTTRIEAARIAVTLTIKLQSGRISPVAVRLIYDHYGPERLGCCGCCFGQEAVKYVENQMQTVSNNVRKFYSDVMQDLCSPDSEDPANGAVSKFPVDLGADVGIYMKPEDGMEEKCGKADDSEQLTEAPKMTTDSGSDCLPLHRRITVRRITRQHSKGSLSNKSNLDTDKNSNCNNASPNEISGATTLSSKFSSNVELSDQNLEASCDQTARLATPGCVEVTDHFSMEESNNEIENASKHVPEISFNKPSLDMVKITETGRHEGTDSRPSSLEESNGVCFAQFFLIFFLFLYL